VATPLGSLRSLRNCRYRSPARRQKRSLLMHGLQRLFSHAALSSPVARDPALAPVV